MSFEGALTRMAAIRSRFPDPRTLGRLVARFDPDALYALLLASPFEEELLRHVPKRTAEGMVPRGMRIVTEGGERLRREMVASLGEAGALAILWEREELIRGLRYHAAHGFERERRYRFLSLLGRPGAFRAWAPSMTLDDFVALLAEGGHPLAPPLDAAVARESLPTAERAVDRYLFATLVPRLTKRYPGTAPFFADQADLVNARTALLAPPGGGERFEPDLWHVDGGGRLALREYRSLCRGESEEREKELALLFGVAPPVGGGNGIAPFARALCRAVLTRQRLRGIADPLGANRVLWFMGEFDARVADLRTALIFGAAGAPVEEAAALFLGRAA